MGGGGCGPDVPVMLTGSGGGGTCIQIGEVFKTCTVSGRLPKARHRLPRRRPFHGLGDVMGSPRPTAFFNGAW